MFTSHPQAVEVHERGAWLPASMLGWRHDSSGACSAWVRVEFAGVVEDAWVELGRLRRPESPASHLILARAPKAAATAAPANPAATQHLPLVRDGGAPAAGRRVPVSEGRRRAPETGQFAGAPSTPLSVVPEGSGPVPGRRRAPAEQGRHRAADSFMPAVVPAGAPTPAIPSPRDAGLRGASAGRSSAAPVRAELPPAGPVVRGEASRGVDGERLSRPMRLVEGVGSARRPRPDASAV